MTIAKPKNKKIRKLIIIASFTLIIFTLSNVFVYNKIVNLQHLIAVQTKDLENFKLADADLKNKLYQILDLKNLGELAKDLGMIKINNPEFLEINESVSFYNINN